MPFNEQPLNTTTVKLSSLAKIEEFLLAGERRQAYQYALDEKLWAHAMLIARSLEADAWMEAVQVFLTTELDAVSSAMPSNDKSAHALQGLKVAYGLFGGLGASSRKFIFCQI